MQLYFDDDQYSELKSMSRKTRKPMAVLVRAALDGFLESAAGLANDSDDPLLGLIGIIEGEPGETNLAEEHDEVLYGGRR